jgi:hypothetical protein
MGIETLMTLDEYRQNVDSKFVRRTVEPPKRLNERYFRQDGEPTQYLMDMCRDIHGIAIANGIKIEELYVFGEHILGSATKETQVDIGLLVYCSMADAGNLHLQLNKAVQTLDPKIKVGRTAGGSDLQIYPAHIHAHIVKPYGVVYDAKANEWITFGKTESDHHDFEWQVLGLKVD